MSTMPKEVTFAGSMALIDWLTNQKNESEKISLNQAKILLLGNTNVGKSNFIELHY